MEEKEHVLVILDFRRASVNIYKVLIPEDKDIGEWVSEEYSEDTFYMLDPKQINIEL